MQSYSMDDSVVRRKILYEEHENQCDGEKSAGIEGTSRSAERVVERLGNDLTSL